MGFAEFLGNEEIVKALRGMLAREHVPSAILFVGPRGVGKYTLARMFAQAVNCERGGNDFCGACDSCARIAKLSDTAPLIEQGLAERGESPDTATIERVPLILEADPDVWAIVPDPVRRKNPVARPMIRMGQLRAVQRAAYFRPQRRKRVFILDGADTMRWTDADVFLKILEEPPESATLILTAQRSDALLPTIRSRCLTFWFAPVPTDAVERLLEKRTEMKKTERNLAAQLADGCPGAALDLDLAESARLRKEALEVVGQAAAGKSYRATFAASARLLKNESESFENILHLFYSLLSDLLEISRGPEKFVLRNPDLRRELEILAARVNDAWIAQAVQNLDRLEGRLRRNVGRQLGLDALAVTLGVR